jgi:hypothetical protein
MDTQDGAQQHPPPVDQHQLDQAQAAIAHLQNQLQALQAQNAVLNQHYQQAQQVAYQLATNQTNQAHQAAAPQQRNQAAEAVLRIPAQQFDGKRSSSKFLREWLADLQSRFRVMQPAPTDQEKITYAAALLVQSAKSWYMQHEHLLLTWVDFTDALQRRFQPLNRQDHAVDRLQTLKQTGAVSTYSSTFNDLVMELPAIPAAVLTRMFVNGLKPGIRRLVKAQMAGQTLVDVQALADQLEGIEHEERGLENSFNVSRSVRAPLGYNKPRHQPIAMQHRDGPAPMELGAKQLHRQPRLAPVTRSFARLSPNTKRVLQTASFCSYCRRTGHSVDQCHARPQRPPARTPDQGNGQRRRT